MGRDYSDHYTWTGWHTGDEVTPEEPGKEWLEIQEDGEEYAVIVLRTDASVFQGSELALEAARSDREMRAERIVNALNAYHDPKEAS